MESRILFSFLIFFFMFTLPAYSVVGKSVQDYENSRASKGLSKEPFHVKGINDDRVFERAYALGASVVLKVFTIENKKSAIIFEADVYVGNNQPIPGSEQEVNKIINNLAPGYIKGIPSVKTKNLENGKFVEMQDYTTGIRIIKVKENNKLMLIKVIYRELARKAKFLYTI